MWSEQSISQLFPFLIDNLFDYFILLKRRRKTRERIHFAQTSEAIFTNNMFKTPAIQHTIPLDHRKQVNLCHKLWQNKDCNTTTSVTHTGDHRYCRLYTQVLLEKVACCSHKPFLCVDIQRVPQVWDILRGRCYRGIT